MDQSTKKKENSSLRVDLIALNSMLIFLVIELMSLWSIGLISGKYYDAKITELGRPLPIVPAIGCTDRCARAGYYLHCILYNGNPMLKLYLKCGRKAYVEGYYDYFGKIDYRTLARKRDWVMAILFFGSAYCFLISGITMCIASVLNGSA